MPQVTLRITQASLNQTALDWPRNMANIYAAVDEAVAQRSDILALEELALTGYEAGDEFQRTDNDRVCAALDDIAAYAAALDPNLVISIGHPWRQQDRDIPAPGDAPFERAKEPLYDRMNLPFNVQALIGGGAVQGMTAKASLYNDERGYEKRNFNEWSVAAAQRAGGVYGTIGIAPGGTGDDRVIPFGRPVVQIRDFAGNAVNIAHAICEEKWVATRYDGHPHDDSRYETDNIIPSVARYLGSRDGLVLLVPNASPPAPGKDERHAHLAALASRHADAVVDTDGLGTSGSTFFQFGHRMIAQDGAVVASGARLSFARAACTTSTITVNAAPPETAAKAHAVMAHEFRHMGQAPRLSVAARDDAAQAWDAPGNPHRHYEEVIRYTAAWLFDYMRKSGSKGIMEALSGGADSAFNSVIVAVMVHMGMTELGVAAFCDELSVRNKDAVMGAAAGGIAAAARECLSEMLTGVYMGTANSSARTRHAAAFLMEGGIDPETNEAVPGIGGRFMSRNVQDLLDLYAAIYAVEDLSVLDPATRQELVRDIADCLNANPHTVSAEDRAAMAEALRRKYPFVDDLATAAQDSVAYENIQARAREVLIMLFANKEGKMAVANPNLDEARNAYSTFGGDLHSGTINLNAHLPKAYQLGVMRYLYEHGVQGVMPPVRALGPVLKNKPSAELMPLGADGAVVQTDEASLQRSFAQMNRISEYMLYERRVTPSGARRLNAGEVYDSCRADPLFGGVDEDGLYNMVRVSYNRWTIAQHKIHASPVAPTFGRNVDHQTSQRTPNLHGGSRDELALLGLRLMFSWAEADGLGWSTRDRAVLERRAWQDEGFVKTFGRLVWCEREDRDFDLRRLYEDVRARGWDELFPPLPAAHPVMRVSAARPAAPQP